MHQKCNAKSDTLPMTGFIVQFVFADIRHVCQFHNHDNYHEPSYTFLPLIMHVSNPKNWSPFSNYKGGDDIKTGGESVGENRVISRYIIVNVVKNNHNDHLTLIMLQFAISVFMLTIADGQLHSFILQPMKSRWPWYRPQSPRLCPDRKYIAMSMEDVSARVFEKKKNI